LDDRGNAAFERDNTVKCPDVDTPNIARLMSRGVD
jgi:hypothetical protein